jgi:hypothetical protein
MFVLKMFDISFKDSFINGIQILNWEEGGLRNITLHWTFNCEVVV